MKTQKRKQRQKGTFLVQVHYNENATLQGEVIWVEQDKRQQFRSEMELLKLIDSAVSVS